MKNMQLPGQWFASMAGRGQQQSARGPFDEIGILNSIVSLPVFHDIVKLQTIIVVHSAGHWFLPAGEDREEAWSACMGRVEVWKME